MRDLIVPIPRPELDLDNVVLALLLPPIVRLTTMRSSPHVTPSDLTTQPLAMLDAFKGPPGMLCRWCWDTVFSKETFSLMSELQWKHRWNCGRKYSKGDTEYCFCEHERISRTFRRSLASIQDSVRDGGCMFCSLLEAAITEAEPRIRDDQKGHIFLDPEACKAVWNARYIESTSDFDISFALPSGWCSISFPRTDRHYFFPSRQCYFRLYPADQDLVFASGSPPIPDSKMKEKACTEAKIRLIGSQFGNYSSPSTQSLKAEGRVLREKIQDCVSNHRQCRVMTARERPSRLLHVSGHPSCPVIVLEERPDAAAQEHIDYVCLSYCWGGDQPGKLTMNRLPRYKKEIPVTTLSKSVLDAATMSLSLGFEYLWVDAYCIIQDSDNDKSIELAKMAAIYSGAICTISVVSAATAGEGWMSPRSNTGLPNACLDNFGVTRLFLYRADSEQLLTPECLILEISEAFAQKPDPEPLHTRGWTLQESLLSPRLLSVSSAYRGRSTLRCAKRIARADGGFVHRTSQLAAWPVNDQDGDGKTTHTNKPGRAVERWYDVLSEYTKNRHLTTKSDKLTALAGIAEEFIRLQDLGVYDVGVYVAGLWSKSLGIDLLWRSDIHCQERGDCRPIDDIYVGPSWSWVSRDHAVSFHKTAYAWGSQSKISYKVVPKDLRNPNGALQYAELTILCGAAELSAARLPNSEIDDRPYTHDRNGTVWYLDLATVEPYNTPHFVGMVVQQVDRKQENKKNPAVDLSGPTLYRRVGMFESGRAAYRQDRPEKSFTII